MIQHLMPLQIKALEYAENHSELLACFSEEDLLHFSTCMRKDITSFAQAARELYGLVRKQREVKNSVQSIIGRALKCLRYNDVHHLDRDTSFQHNVALIINDQILSTCAWNPDIKVYSFIVPSSNLHMPKDAYTCLLHWSSVPTGFHFSGIQYDGSITNDFNYLYQFLIKANYIPFTIAKYGLKIDHHLIPLNKNEILLTNKFGSPPSVQTKI